MKPGFRVEGRHLLSPSGETVVLRGINEMFVWGDKSGASLPEIARTGANCVRIVWTLADGTARELDALVGRALEAGLVPIVEFHDATGDLSRIPSLVDGWTSAPYLEMLRRRERHLLVNIANEAGDDRTTPAEFFAAYAHAVRRMRKAGVRVPLMIDAPEWGKSWETMAEVADDLLDADPEYNLLFSVHMWWSVRSHASRQTVEERIRATVAEAVRRDLPMVVGEFGAAFSRFEAAGVVEPGDEIPWELILAQCQEYGIGWLAWSWGGVPNRPQSDLDMAPGGRLEDLRGWGRSVALDHPCSIRNTSKPCECIRSGFIQGDGSAP